MGQERLDGGPTAGNSWSKGSSVDGSSQLEGVVDLTAVSRNSVHVPLECEGHHVGATRGGSQRYGCRVAGYPHVGNGFDPITIAPQEGGSSDESVDHGSCLG